MKGDLAPNFGPEPVEEDEPRCRFDFRRVRRVELLSFFKPTIFLYLSMSSKSVTSLVPFATDFTFRDF